MTKIWEIVKIILMKSQILQNYFMIESIISSAGLAKQFY